MALLVFFTKVGPITTVPEIQKRRHTLQVLGAVPRIKLEVVEIAGKVINLNKEFFH